MFEETEKSCYDYASSFASITCHNLEMKISWFTMKLHYKMLQQITPDTEC